MSHLLFMDESGHDGRGPYEVRGGVALPSDRVWKFTRRMRGLESRCFGDLLRNHGSELHGIKLMERRRLRLARSRPNFPDDERQALCRTYLGQGRNGQAPTLEMAIAYGQAGVLFVGKLLDLIKNHRGRVFASIVPSGQAAPVRSVPQTFVRRDVCLLFERFYYFLEEMESDGILVLDETDRTDDKRFLSRLERYFSRHEVGKTHANLIIPTPLFTASEMSYPIQAADIVIYLIANGLRLPAMSVSARDDLKRSWIEKVQGLQYETARTDRYGDVFTRRSILFVEDPWGVRR